MKSAWTNLKIDRKLWQGIAFIAAITLLAYVNVLSAGFIWDDDDYVINNLCLRSLFGLQNIWTVPGATPQYYPLVFTVFWMQYHAWGLNPLGYHLVNILLHILNAFLLWRCVKRLDIPGALLAGCIFAVHPVHVESAAWITELKNVLSTAFYFLAFLCYSRFSPVDQESVLMTGRRQLYWLGALLLFVCALFSKTVAGSLPAAILLVYWWKRERFVWKEVLWLMPFFVLAVLMGRLTAHLEITHVKATGPAWEFSFIERFLIAGRAVWFYAAKLVWPHPLIFTYPRWQIDSSAWWQYLYPLGLLLVMTTLWFARQRIGRGPVTAMLFFVGTLFPALGFFNIYPMIFSFVADHFQYLASAAIIVFICAGLERVFAGDNPRRNRFKPLVYGAILLTCGALTWHQGKVYKDRLSLFNDVIAKNPSSWMAYNNRGAWYYLSEEYDKAWADVQQGIDLNPNYAGAYNNRALIYLLDEDYELAMIDFNKALSMEPNRPDFLINRGKLHLDLGHTEQALADYDKVLKLAPNYEMGHLLRAIIYGMHEEYDKALADINKVLRLDPDNADAYANRGLIYYRQGVQDKAISDFNRALSLNPQSAATCFNRALAHAAKGDRVRTLADLKLARRLGYSLTEADIQTILSNVKGIQ